MCQGEAPDVFGFDEDADQVTVLAEHPDESLRPQVQAAVRYCPAMALCHRGELMSLTRAEIEEFWETWLEVNREAERIGDWTIMADWYAEDATYGWMYTPDEHFMAIGREEIRDIAIGQEMAGLDGWHYDYQCTMVDEAKGMVLGFWKQKSGITDDATGKEYEILGIGGSWFGVERQADGEPEVRLAARLVRPRLDRDDVPRDRRLRQGAAGAARPDERQRQGAARPLPARRAALDAVAAAGRARGLHHAGVRTVTTPPAQLLIDGKLVPASSGATYPILNPATGAEIGRAPDATAADVDAAIAAARRAFDETDWSTNVELRVRCLRQLHQALLDHADDFRALTTAEVGMPAFMQTAAGLRRPGRGAEVGRRPGRVLRLRDRPRCRGADGHPEPADRTPRAGRRGRRDHAVERARPRSTSPRSAPRWPPAARWCSSRRRTPRGWPASSAGWPPSTPTCRRACSTSSRRAPTRWPPS